MTVAELICALQRMDQSAEVRIAYNNGDYWNTIIAPLAGRVTEENITYSRRVGFMLATGNEDNDDNVTQSVVIR